VYMGLRVLPPREGSFGAATCPTTPIGLWTVGIKKDLAALGTQLISRVSKARSYVINVHLRRACHYSAALQCNTDPVDHSEI
jgi:hypothetical protein